MHVGRGGGQNDGPFGTLWVGSVIWVRPRHLRPHARAPIRQATRQLVHSLWMVPRQVADLGRIVGQIEELVSARLIELDELPVPFTHRAAGPPSLIAVMRIVP